MEETSGAIIDQVGSETAEPVDAGQVYSVSGPASWGSAVSLTDNGGWKWGCHMQRSVAPGLSVLSKQTHGSKTTFNVTTLIGSAQSLKNLPEE